jgi:hypothetical protein
MPSQRSIDGLRSKEESDGFVMLCDVRVRRRGGEERQKGGRTRENEGRKRRREERRIYADLLLATGNTLLTIAIILCLSTEVSTTFKKWYSH